MLNKRLWLSTLLFSLCVGPVAASGNLFLDLTVEEALARAKAEEKLVFIDFTATWCGPCQQLDSTTFADREVIAWLGEHTVPLKVDVDQQKDTAREFRVSSMPTLVFLRADGTELQRIRGYQTAGAFIEAAGEVAEHPEKDSVARAREELESGNWPEAMARQKLAAALAAGSDQEEALAEYAKGMDSLGTDPMSRKFEVRLVHEICSMARDYAPAGEMMRALREKLVARLESGEADRHDVDLITAIDSGLDQKEKTLELYTRLKEKGDVSPEVMAGFAGSSRELQLEDRQYAALEKEMHGGVLFRALADINSLERQKALAGGDVSGLSGDLAEMAKQRYANMSEEQRARMAADLTDHFVDNIGELYQIALGVGKVEDAGVIARKLLEAVPTATAYHTLAANALRSGKATRADLGFAEKAVELDQGEHPEYSEVRDRLLEQLGPAEKTPAGETAVQD